MNLKTMTNDDLKSLIDAAVQELTSRLNGGSGIDRGTAICNFIKECHASGMQHVRAIKATRARFGIDLVTVMQFNRALSLDWSQNPG